MSEVRKTTTIRRVEAPPAEPMISLADILAGAGWLAFQGAKLAAKVTIAGGSLACKGIHAASKSLHEARQARARDSEIVPLVRESENVQQAIIDLAADRRLEIPQRQAGQLKVRLQKLAASNDNAGTIALANELLIARQDRLQTTLLNLAEESCNEIGLLANISNGQVVAKSADGRQTFTVDVEKTKDGDVSMHRDSDGFRGATCAPVHDAFDNAMRAKGVRFDDEEPRRKHSRGAYVGGRLPPSVHVHNSNR